MSQTMPKASQLDEFDTELGAELDKALDETNQPERPAMPRQEVTTTSPVAAAGQADRQLDNLRRGTQSVIDKLEANRDESIEQLQRSLAMRIQSMREELEAVQMARDNALEIARVNGEQALALQKAITEDTGRSEEQIAQEREKFKLMIQAQRGVLELINK